jgi:hypothetical protein
MATLWMEIEIEPAGDELRVAARGSRGERPAPFSLGPGVTRDRLALFTRDVGRAVRSGQRLGPTLLAEAQALYEALHQGGLRELEARLLEASKDGRLLQRLLLRDRALQAVPWEALCRPGSTEDFWGSSGTRLLARGVTSESPWEPREVRGAVRLLAVAPSSSSGALESLKAAVGPAIETGEIEWLEPIAGNLASKRSFFDQLRRGKTPHVLHFLGHGSVDAQGDPTLRVADDEDGEEVWIKVESLTQEFAASFGGDLRLVVLEACEGAKPGALGSAAELLARSGADAVVAHLWPVKADVARLGSRDFYRSLTGAKSALGDVVASLGAARRTLLLESAEGFSPVVYMRGAGSAIFRFEGRRVSPPKAPSSTAAVASSRGAKTLAPALQSLLERPFSMILGDREEDTSALRAQLEQVLTESGDRSWEGLSLHALTQRCELRFGQKMLRSLFQRALVGALGGASPAPPPLIDALARHLRPGVHITLLWRPLLELAIARHHPGRTVYVIQPDSSSASGMPQVLKRKGGASAWQMEMNLPRRFELDADLVVLRLYGGYSPEPQPTLMEPLLTEDDHIQGLVGLEGFRTPRWAEQLMGWVRMTPGLFVGLSVLEWSHRMLLRWLYNQSPAPSDSVALLNPKADPIELQILQRGGGLPGTGRLTALREDPEELAAQLEARSRAAAAEEGAA